jgi:hypothetical protein
MRHFVYLLVMLIGSSALAADFPVTPQKLLGYQPLSPTSAVPCLQQLGSVPCINQANANLVINPSMDIDQANEGASVSVSSAGTAVYSADGWKVQATSAATGLTIQQLGTTPPTGFAKYLHFVVGTGSATVNAGDYIKIFQPIEAGNITNLGFGTTTAVSLCLSWYSRSSIASYIYSIALQNAALTRSYVATVQESGTASTWMQHAICPIGDITGTWVTSGTAEGLRANFALEVGTTFQTGSNNHRLWTGANVLTSNEVQPTQLSKTSSATFDLTGIKLEFLPNGWPLAATPFARSPAGLDVINAQRYYVKTFPLGTAPAQSGGLAGCLSVIAPSTTAAAWGIFWPFPAVMRANPTVTTYNPAAANANWRDITTTTTVPTAAVDTSTASISPNGVMIRSTTTGANAIGDNMCIQATADARL